MKVILTDNVNKLGSSGDVVQVKNGYARNFLIPKGLAIMATQSNLNRLMEDNKKKFQHLEKKKKEALEFAHRLEGLSVNVAVETYEEDKLYGSVTALDISRALEAENLKIDKNNIIISEPIKSLGIFDCIIKVHPEVEAKIKVWVVKN